MKKKINCKDAILDAAEDVVIKSGAVHMTLDAVYQKAGISKGGLLYHFPSKDALIDAMLKRVIKQVEDSQKRKVAILQNVPHKEIKAHVLAFLSQSKRTNRICAALAVASANDPKLLAPVRKSFRKVFQEYIESGLKFERAAVITLAVDGLWLTQILGVSFFNAKQRKTIVKEMLAIADQ
jgi:AcrR family transcriptional regulator